MSSNRKREWAPPKIATFRTEEELWAHYSTRATSQELSSLKSLFAQRSPSYPEPKREFRRRA